jgi:hypothetical protein
MALVSLDHREWARVVVERTVVEEVVWPDDEGASGLAGVLEQRDIAGSAGFPASGIRRERRAPIPLCRNSRSDRGVIGRVPEMNTLPVWPGSLDQNNHRGQRDDRCEGPGCGDPASTSSMHLPKETEGSAERFLRLALRIVER